MRALGSTPILEGLRVAAWPRPSHAASLLVAMARHWPPLELARMLVGEATPAGKSVAEAQPALLGCLAAPLAQHALTRATLDEVTKPLGLCAGYPLAKVVAVWLSLPPCRNCPCS